MKPSVLALGILALASLSCATVSGPGNQTVPKAAPKAAPVTRAPIERGGSTLENLDTPTRAYLDQLSRAFARQDAAFLLQQGEKNYEKRVKHFVSDEEYLALLYRTGPYAAETERAPLTAPALKLATVASLRLTKWTEKGPVIAVSGTIQYKNGKKEDCLLFVLWKTNPPCIIGREL